VIPVAVLHKQMDVIDGSLQSATPVRPNSILWLQGTLILEASRDLVIPACQSRALWTGVTTGYAEPRIFKIGAVQIGLNEVLKNSAQRNTGRVLP